MELKRISIDFSALIRETLDANREQWLSYYRQQRSVLAALPDDAGAGAVNATRWSPRTFAKAVEWATWNPADLGHLVWASLQTFLRRLGSLYSVRLLVNEDTSGNSYVASFEGTEAVVQRAKEAAEMGAKLFAQDAPHGNGYLFRWSVAINPDMELELFKKKERIAYDYLAVRTAGMMELSRENEAVARYHRGTLVPAVAAQFGVDREDALKFIDGGGLREDALKSSAAQAVFAAYRQAHQLSQLVVDEIVASLTRARQARLLLPVEYQRALLVNPAYSHVLHDVAKDPRGGYDFTFASELAVTAEGAGMPSDSSLPLPDPQDLPFRGRRGQTGAPGGEEPDLPGS
jgi:hypothetical protein